VFSENAFLKIPIYTVDGSVSGNTNYQYGFNPACRYSTLRNERYSPDLIAAAINAGIRSSHTDSSKLSYDASFGYKFMQNRFKQNQNAISFNV
jgi:hypothetical protein